MKVCFCESGDLGRAGDYTTIKEATINAGIFGKGSATLAMIGGDGKMCLDVSIGEHSIEKTVAIKYCPFCGRRLAK